MFHNPKKQQGSVIIVSVFVIVVMGMMAAMLNRTQWSNQDSHVREVNGAHAWLAAASSTEEVLTRIYPLNSSAADSSICKGDGDDDSNIAALSFERCTIKSTCDKKGNDELSYIHVKSTAKCGTGIHQVERRHEVWGKE